MIQIDAAIRAALWAIQEKESISQRVLAGRLSVSQGNLSHWLSGKTTSCANRRWEIMAPLLAPYLPTDYKPTLSGGGALPERQLGDLMMDIFTDLPRLQQLDVLHYAEKLRLTAAPDEPDKE